MYHPVQTTQMLPGFHRFSMLFRCRWVLAAPFTGFYRVLPGFTGFYWVLAGFFLIGVCGRCDGLGLIWKSGKVNVVHVQPSFFFSSSSFSSSSSSFSSSFSSSIGFSGHIQGVCVCVKKVVTERP